MGGTFMDDIITHQINSNFLIRITHSKRQGYYTMPNNHYHDHYEIYYLLDGERNYFIKDKIYSVKKGDLVLIDSNDIHKTIDGGLPHHERLLIDFKEEFLYLISREEIDYLLSPFKIGKPIIRLGASDQAIAKNIINKMLQEQLIKKSGYMISLKAHLLELLIFTNRLIEEKDIIIAYTDTNTGKNERISKIVRYINSHYSDPLSLSTIADTFYISPYYLSRLFKQVTGFNLVEYLNLVRIREAEKLLQNSDMKIIEVSQMVGFQNVTHFGRVFKKITSLTPSAYRKQYVK